MRSRRGAPRGEAARARRRARPRAHPRARLERRRGAPGPLRPAALRTPRSTPTGSADQKSKFGVGATALSFDRFQNGVLGFSRNSNVDVLLYSTDWPKYSRSGELPKIPVGSGRAHWFTESTSVAPTLEPHQGSPFVVKSWLSFLKCAASYSFSARMRSQPGLAPPGSFTKRCSYSRVVSS